MEKTGIHGLDRFEQQLESNQVKPVYFVLGPEIFFKNHMIRLAQEKLIQASAKEFNLNIFFCPDNTDSQILNACYALPMMSDRRLVVVHDVDLLTVSDTDAFENYFKQASPSTVVIFTAKKQDKRKKLFALLQKYAEIIEAEPFKSETAILNWLDSRIRNKGYSIDPEAKELLYQFIGDNLFDLDQHVEKITLFKGDDKQINSKDIEDMTGISREFSVFEMINQLLQRNRQQTMKIVHVLFEQGQEAIAIIGALYYRFSKQWQFAQHLHQKSSEQEMLSKSGIRRFAIGGFRKAASLYNRDQLEKSLQSLARADVALKSTSNDPKNVVIFTLEEILSH